MRAKTQDPFLDLAPKVKPHFSELHRVLRLQVNQQLLVPAVEKDEQLFTENFALNFKRQIDLFYM